MKRKNGKHIVHIILAGLLCLCLTGCSVPRALESGDFFYKVQNGEVGIVGLSGEGRKKEEIIVPPFIDGKKVTFFNERQGGYVYDGYTNIESDELVRFYAPYTLLKVYANMGGAIRGKNLIAIFYPSYALFENGEFDDRDNLKDIFNRESYVTIKAYNYLSEIHSEIYIKKVHPANVAYLFNYENSPNDNYYFIDNVEGGSLIRNAPAPEREGYEFQGWYKDAACENAWDFDADTTAETLYDENEKEVFAETKLYAKWQAK